MRDKVCHFHHNKIRSTFTWRKDITVPDMVDPFLPGYRCATADEADDKAGADLWAVPPAGPKHLPIYAIDHKIAQQKGLEKHWRRRNGVIVPNLPIETWSSKPTVDWEGKVGWARDPDKITDYVLFVFSPTDTPDVFLANFSELQPLAAQNWEKWLKCFAWSDQDNGTYISQCCFVPMDMLQRWGVTIERRTVNGTFQDISEFKAGGDSPPKS